MVRCQLSIVVCSRSESNFKSLERNVADTVGVKFEILRVDNSINQYSICQAYNLGAKSARYSYICFVHEDIKFKTHGWGKLIISHLTDPKVGLIGVAGASYNSEVPSMWSWVHPSFIKMNLYQGYKRRGGEVRHLYVGDGTKDADVVVLDGVLLATRKDVLETCSFDDHLLKGFHGYDVDFSLQVFQRYKVKVVYDVLLEHFSEGSLNREWMDSAILINKKWKERLYASINPVPFEHRKKLYYDDLFNYLYKMNSLGFTKSEMMENLRSFYDFKYFDVRYVSLLLYKISKSLVAC